MMKHIEYSIKHNMAFDYADTISELLENRQKREDMSKQAMARCEKFFSIERMTDEHAAYFKEIEEQDIKVKPLAILYRKASWSALFRGMIPMRLKKWIREKCEYFGVSI